MKHGMTETLVRTGYPAKIDDETRRKLAELQEVYRLFTYNTDNKLPHSYFCAMEKGFMRRVFLGYIYIYPTISTCVCSYIHLTLPFYIQCVHCRH